MNFLDIKRSLEQNQDIQKEIREIVYENYYDIYNFLGKKDFLKWINQRNLTIEVRNIVYRTLTGEEDKFLRDNPDVLGYHLGPRTTEEKRKIVLRKGVGSNKDVSAHETYHAIVDGLGGFNTFFGEGLTEFFRKTMYNRNTYNYKKNVETVFLTYTMFGNIILKDYLSKKGDRFFFHLARGTNNNRFEVMMKTGESINYLFEKYHKIIFCSKDITAEDLAKADEALKDGVSGLLSFHYMYKREQIERFKHIKSNQIDFNQFIDEQAGIIKYLNVLNTNREEYKEIFEKAYYLRCQLIEQMVRNSHLCFRKSENEKEELVNAIIEDVNNRIINRAFGRYLSIEETHIDQEVEEPYKSLNINATGKLVVEFLYNDKCKDLYTTIRKITDIQAATTKFSSEEFVDTIKFIMKENLKNEKALSKLGNLDNFVTNMENIAELERKYEYDLQTPSFIKVQLEGLEDFNTYVEFSDDRSYLVLVDIENGKLDRVSLDEEDKSSKFKIYTKNDDDTTKQGTTTCHVYRMDIGTEAKLVLEPKKYSVNITNGKVKIRLNNGTKSIYEDTLNEVSFKQINDNIELGTYSNVILTDQNETTRDIEVEEFIQDYIEVQEIIPGLDKYNMFFEMMCDKLIDKTFESEKIPEGTSLGEAYDKQKQIIVKDMKDLLKEKQKESNDLKKEEIHNKIDLGMKNLDTFSKKAKLRSNKPDFKDVQEAKSDFLKKAVIGTTKMARTTNILNSLEHIQAGLFHKTNEEMRGEHGNI